MCNNPKLDLVNTNAYTTFGKILSFVLKILSRDEILNEILTSIKGPNSVTNARKMMCNYLNLDLVNIKVYIKFSEILSIFSQDIEQKRNYDGQTDRMTKGIMDSPDPV